jgi:hypothetical protein
MMGTNILPLATVVPALELNLECLAEDAQGVVVGVEGAVDHGGNQSFGVVVEQGGFEHALAGARFTQDQTESALLGVDAQDVEDFLLVSQEADGFGVEGMALEAKMRTDHS